MTNTKYLLSLLLLAGCAAAQPMQTAPTEPPRCAWNGVMPERTCFYSIQDIAYLKQQPRAPVNISGGYLHRRGGIYMLSPDATGKGPSVVIDTAPLPAGELPYGVLPILGWRTVAFGYFTSADITAPALPDAAGTLHARSLGFHGDPQKRDGPHREIVRRQLAARKSGKPEVIFAVPPVISGRQRDLSEACAAWHLEEDEATRFFDMSEQRDAPAPRHAEPPCSIYGLVEADGRTWEFAINPDGSGTWRSGTQVRHWSCPAGRCTGLLPGPSDN